MAGPLTLIQAPLTGPPKVGLLASFAPTTPTNPDGSPARWEGGISFQPGFCDGAARANINCGTTGTRTPPEQPENVEWMPYEIFAADECSTLENARDSEGRARRALDRCRSSQIAAELWTGALAKATTPDLPNHYLASPDSDVLSPGTGLTPLDALACLEQGLAQSGCGTRGVIHATRQVVTQWDAGGALRREGSVILTVHDTIVVPDAGYTGSDQNGVAPNDTNGVWAYATGPIVIHLGEVFVNAVLDHATNTRTTWASQLAMAYWDLCAHLGVQIGVDVCDFGGAGS